MPEHSEQLLRLVDTAQFTEIGFVEIAARFAPSPDADLTNIDARPRWTLHVRSDSGRFQLNLRIDVETPVGPVAVEAAAQYATQDGAPELTTELLVEYANEVGVMALLPFVRQAVADVTQRVFGSALVMPVMPRGAVAFTTAEVVCD